MVTYLSETFVWCRFTMVWCPPTQCMLWTWSASCPGSGTPATKNWSRTTCTGSASLRKTACSSAENHWHRTEYELWIWSGTKHKIIPTWKCDGEQCVQKTEFLFYNTWKITAPLHKTTKHEWNMMKESSWTVDTKWAVSSSQQPIADKLALLLLYFCQFHQPIWQTTNRHLELLLYCESLIWWKKLKMFGI